MTIVNILLKDDDLSNSPIVGANVAIYNIGAIFQTSAITDSSGAVSFMLSDSSYRVYIYKERFSVQQPQTIILNNSDPSNTFQIIGHLKTLPQTLNMDLIRVSGYLKQPNGTPKAIYDLKFLHIVTPPEQVSCNEWNFRYNTWDKPDLNKVVNDDVITNTIISTKSDNNGYVEFDLYRKTTYEVNMPEGDFVRCQTADIPAIELSRLVYPIPANLTISSSSKSISLASGTNHDLTFTCLFTDHIYRNGGSDWAYVKPIYSVPNIAGISFNGNGTVNLCPLTAGTTVITFEVKFINNFVWVNPPTFIFTTLTVVVT